MVKQGEIANRFLAFYATGKVADTDNALDIVLAMGALIFKDKATKSTDLTWDDSQFMTNPSSHLLSMDGEPALNPETSTGTKQISESIMMTTVGINTALIDIDEDGIIQYGSPADRTARLAGEQGLRAEDDLDKLSTLVRQYLHE